MSTKEVTTASAATFEHALVNASPDAPWTLSTESGQPCVVLDSNTVVRVAPMTRQFRGWNNAHFNYHLRLPMEAPVTNGVVVTLEARAPECVAVALSPDSSFQLGKTYVVHFGAAGNVSTVIRRRLETGTEAVDVTFASRVCSESAWVSYWIVLLGNGKLYVGTGKDIGQQCIGLLDDSLYTQLRPESDAVRYVGLSNSALGRHARPLKIRHVCVTSVPEYLPAVLESLPTDLDLVNVEQQDEETRALMEEYRKECQKNMARAKKFGVPYKEPSPQAFLQWSQARKLRANPEKGFITGIDVMAPEEVAKQEARRARFGIKRKEVEEEDDKQQGGESMEEDVLEPLPILQAWDNETLVREHRTDPPTSLYLNPPPSDEVREETEEFAMEADSTPATLVPEKIHICSIDWAAFKQIRTEDIMAYFRNYGPSYVEWLGELSCNVLFEDKFSASRALHNMSQELPSPPPVEVEVAIGTEETEGAPPDLNNMGWRFCVQPIRKVHNDRYGRKGTTARVLMRAGNSADLLVERPKSRPRPPPGFTTKRVLGPGSDYDTEPRQKKRRRMEPDREADRYDPTSGEEHPGLSRGLRSGREGFTVEELQKERASKMKSQEDTAPDEQDKPS